MLNIERAVVYPLLILSLVGTAFLYAQKQSNKSSQQVEISQSPTITPVSSTSIQPTESNTASPAADGTKISLQSVLKTIPFQAFDANVTEGGPLTNVHCSDESSPLSLGDSYRVYRVGGQGGVYIQSEQSKRNWQADFDQIKTALTNDGFVQCTNESDINYPWPQVSFRKGFKGAVLIGVVPRGVEGSIELYLEP